MQRFVLFTLVLFALPALAQSIYRTTDENGNVVFTDAPPAGTEQQIERIENPQINSMPPPERIDADDEATSDEPETAASFSVRITSPADETTIPNGPGNFSVSASVSPAIQPEHSLQLFMDGAPWGDSQRSAYWSLTNVFRGQHDLTVAVIDDDGETVATSDPVRVYVFRPIAR